MTIQNISEPFSASTPIKSQTEDSKQPLQIASSLYDRQSPTTLPEDWFNLLETEIPRPYSEPPSTPFAQRIERRSDSALDTLSQRFGALAEGASLDSFFAERACFSTPLLATPLTKAGEKEDTILRPASASLSKLEPALFEELIAKNQIPPSQTVTPTSGHYVFHTTDPKERKTLSNISNLWGETARARFLHTRDHLTPLKKATQDDANHDLAQMTDYIDVIKYFKGNAKPQDSQHFLALIDAAQNVQGLAKLTEKQGDHPHLYLNALLTAAWNLPQKGETPNKLSRKIPQTRGTGIALVAASCQLANQLGLPAIETSPSARARSFYTDTLEMPYNAETQTCVLDLSKNLPKRLQAVKDILLTRSATYSIPPTPFQDSDDDEG